ARPDRRGVGRGCVVHRGHRQRHGARGRCGGMIRVSSRGRDAVERTARDGDWIGVFGAQVTLLLPADARSRAARAWPLVDADADHVEVLDDLLADGLAQLCDFVLVEQVGDRTRVVARGDAEVTAHSAEGRVRVRASDLTWQEDVFVGLVALQVALPGTAVIDTGHFDVRPGICRVGGVAWGEVPD